jgi:hypothetical protein
MSTITVPVLDRNKLNAFVGPFVTDPGAPVHTGVPVVYEARP